MGVPKFYRWISERYPCLSEIVKEYQIPEFDNLYLDMNGIIHICSHPNDEDPHFRITEEKIFKDIFQYVEILFRLIRPRKVFFMAVDGVAPRAKMNQQRGRRFRSAREAEELEKKALRKGEVLPTEERFDSNCITPGTAFMVRLHEQLKYFVTMKVSTDKLWHGIRIYLSGHETPGEGEHKIMDFIRSEKSKEDYDPNTRHCLYGLDADLIMLGLCTHEPHFSLLREEVQFGGKKSQKRAVMAQETTFHLLHLSLMREYLDFEFSILKGKLCFDYDLEKTIDDWVLMGFLVGNDFIPHLPHMHIAHDALPMLYKVYIEVLPTLDGYINEGGYLNIARFEKYLTRVAQFDYDHFTDHYTDLKWFKEKISRKGNENEAEQLPIKKKPKMSANVFDVLANIADDEFQEEIPNADVAGNVLFDGLNSPPTEKLIDLDSPDSEDDEDDDDDDDDDEDEVDESEDDERNETEEDLFEMEFQQHKRDYYMNKLDYPSVTKEVLKDQAECYVRAIQWNLHYYYNGVCSWSWYYPHHYAPYISDIKGFANMKLEFELGTPFLPFQQLLAVLPAASKKLLPVAYQNLMVTEDSPLIDYYPLDFKTDLNGKLQEWEAVVLIPFINENQLLKAMEPLENKMTEEERRRNRHGPCLLHTYTSERLPIYPSPLPEVFPDVVANYAKCEELPKDAFFVEHCNLRKGLCTNVQLDVYFPGFPTLKHIKHTAELKKAGVRVFQMNSRAENMILQITEVAEADCLTKIASTLLGQTIFVTWPHLVEAKVTAISDGKVRLAVVESKNSKQAKPDVRQEYLNEQEGSIWRQQCESIKDHYFERLGIVIGETMYLVFACPLMGKKYMYSSHGRVTLEKQWAISPLSYAYQTTVQDIAAHDPNFRQFQTIDELFKSKTACFMLSYPHYGSFGEVVEVSSKVKGHILVDFAVLQEPNLDPIIKKQHKLTINYMPGYVIAQRLGISSLLLSRLTGTFFINPGSRRNPVSQRVNVGLNLKFNKKNKEVPGYTKKTADGWLYSLQALDIMAEYIERYQELFEYIATHVQEGNCYAADIFHESNCAESLQEMQAWLKSLPCHSVQPQACGTEILDEPIIQAIEEVTSKTVAGNAKGKKHVTIHTKPSNLYLPCAQEGSSEPDPMAMHQLFDRVVNVREGFSVPLGLRGTVAGIHLGEKQADTRYDVIFDEEFLGGMPIRCSGNKGYKMPSFAFINLTHGLREEQLHNKNKQKNTVQKSNKTSNADVNANDKKNAQSKRGSRMVANFHSPPSSSGQGQNSQEQNSPLNKINHSPNSPFIPRQVQQQQQRSDKYDHQQDDAVEDDDKFYNVWQQLQTASGQKPFRPTAGGAGQRTTSNNYEMEHLPSFTRKQPSRGAKIKPFRNNTSTVVSHPASKSENCATGEFGSFLHALETTNSSAHSNNMQSGEDNYNVNSTAALMQMLNIGKEQPSPTHASDRNTNFATVRGESHPGMKSGVKVKPFSHKNAANANVPAPNHQSQFLYPSQQQPVPNNAVHELNHLVKMFFNDGPSYSKMFTGPNQKVVMAQVTLPNGRSYYSNHCFSEFEAYESAATFAMKDLRAQVNKQIGPPIWQMSHQPPPPPMRPSMGRGYHGCQHQQLLRANFGNDYQFDGYQYQQMPYQSGVPGNQWWGQTPRQYDHLDQSGHLNNNFSDGHQQHHGVYRNQPGWQHPSSSMGIDNNAAMFNNLIPMQVIKQSHTAKKSPWQSGMNAGMSVHQDESLVTQQQCESEQSVGVENTGHLVREHANSSADVSESSNINEHRQKKQPRRSRLAINFNVANAS